MKIFVLESNDLQYDGLENEVATDIGNEEEENDGATEGEEIQKDESEDEVTLKRAKKVLRWFITKDIHMQI